MSNINDVLSQFSKKEIMSVAKELGLDAQPDDQKVQLVNEIVRLGTRLSNDPNSDVDISELAVSMLVTAEVIDEEGNPLVKEEDDSDVELPENLPECWGYADDKDPACGKCIVMKQCMKLRISRRPQCFGELFSVHAPECIACLEAKFCKIEVERK